MQHGKEFIKLESREMSLNFFSNCQFAKSCMTFSSNLRNYLLSLQKIGNVTNHHISIIHFLSEKALKSWISLFELPYVLTTVLNDHEILVYIYKDIPRYVKYTISDIPRYTKMTSPNTN